MPAASEHTRAGQKAAVGPSSSGWLLRDLGTVLTSAARIPFGDSRPGGFGVQAGDAATGLPGTWFFVQK